MLFSKYKNRKTKFNNQNSSSLKVVGYKKGCKSCDLQPFDRN